MGRGPARALPDEDYDSKALRTWKGPAEHPCELDVFSEGRGGPGGRLWSEEDFCQ
jgi:hypothetical protein